MADVLGNFEQAVLLALARPKTELGKEAYGRAVLKEVQLRLDREVSAGAVYATLDRLEQKGLIRSEVREGGETRGGLPRRHYTIEAAGIDATRRPEELAIDEWLRLSRALRA